ncbi:MAG TPA: hypothetical protein VF283_16990 [Bryobacteraceae bacterium]
MRVATRFFSVLLTPLIAVLPLAAQTPLAVAPVPSQTAPLRIKVVDRDAATVPPGSRARKGYMVEVTDASGKPVSGAAVVCRLPDAAPTGTFAKASHSSVLFTGGNGLAHFSGIQWGGEEGTVVLRVTANKRGAHAGILIEQTLARAAAPVATPAVSITPNPARKPQRPLLPPRGVSFAPHALPAIAQPEVSVTKPPAGVKSRHSNKKKWLILALVAGAAAGAVGFAARGKSSSNSSSAPVQMSIGSPTISVGQP